MSITLIPTHLFIQNNILYITSGELTDFFLKRYANSPTPMITLDSPTLWQLKEENATSQLTLHIELYNPDDFISIDFSTQDTTKIIQNRNEFFAIGVLLPFNPEYGDADGVILFTDVSEGLELIAKDL